MGEPDLHRRRLTMATLLLSSWGPSQGSSEPSSANGKWKALSGRRSAASTPVEERPHEEQVIDIRDRIKSAREPESAIADS